MKMKQTAAILTALIVVFAGVGCGNNGGNADPGGSTASQSGENEPGGERARAKGKRPRAMDKHGGNAAPWNKEADGRQARSRAMGKHGGKPPYPHVYYNEGRLREKHRMRGQA